MRVNDFDIEAEPAGHMVFFTYEDRPGIIGTVGTILGEHDINIATMDVGRKIEEREALMCLTVDSEVPHAASWSTSPRTIEAQPPARVLAPRLRVRHARVISCSSHEAGPSMIGPRHGLTRSAASRAR